jgi:hypothetical protein
MPSRLLIAVLLLGPLAGCATGGPEAAPDTGATPHADRLVGISYHPWFPPIRWTETWGRPVLGHYDSADEFVVRQHVRWLMDAGVDFLVLDWSNNLRAADSPELQQIEAATRRIFEIFATFDRGPRLAFLLGIDSDPANLENGALQAKVDALHAEYAADPRFAPWLQTHEGKPLLLVYVGTPSPWPEGTPPWDDPRFTVRWVTAHLDEQPGLLDANGGAEGYWSWWERTPQRHATHQGKPECVTVSAAFTGPTGWDDPAARGRRDGQTFAEQWVRAQELGPRFVLINSWNEWYRAEEQDEEFSNDLEPSKAHQYLYLQLLEHGIEAWKTPPAAEGG